MNSTPRLGLPFLSAGQAQKEIFHNEALQALDSVVAGAVEEGPTNTPPDDPSLGACYLLDVSPTGSWAGQSLCLAAWTSGGWRFTQPLEGMCLFVRSSDKWAVYRAGSWEVGMLRGSSVTLDGKQVVGSRLEAIADPAGGAVVDAEARSTLSAVLSALRQHGLIET